jgi:hypothetical protein
VDETGGVLSSSPGFDLHVPTELTVVVHNPPLRNHLGPHLSREVTPPSHERLLRNVGREAGSNRVVTVQGSTFSVPEFPDSHSAQQS